MTEFEKMVAGDLYNPDDEYLTQIRQRAHHLCTEYNHSYEDTDKIRRAEILKELLPNAGAEAFLPGPIYFDYGLNFYTGKNFFANFNFTVLDCAPVIIGNNVMIGTSVSLLTPVHDFDSKKRNTFLEFARPISIGDNCWLASNVTVIGGVKIGSGSVIGAGSVVTRDIPENVFAAGSPCRVIREIVS